MARADRSVGPLFTLLILGFASASVTGCPAAETPATSPGPAAGAAGAAGATAETPAAASAGGGGAAGAAASDSSEGWLGIHFSTARDEEDEGESPPPGVRIVNVVAGSPAEAAGVVAGDRIVTLNDQKVGDSGRLGDALRFFGPGRRVKLGRWRDGEVAAVTIEVGVFDTAALGRAALERGAAFLAAAQTPDGSFPHFQLAGREPSAPSTALALRAYAQLPADLQKKHAKTIDAAIGYLKGLVNEAGAVHAGDETVNYTTYTTALTLSALAVLDREPETVAKIRDYLAGRQLHEKHDISEYEFLFYGSWNYFHEDTRSTLRGDVSISAACLEALYRAGLSEDHEDYARARLFLSRCHNYRGLEAPDHVAKIYDGGFCFNPRESKAGTEKLKNGRVRFRSYGSASSDGLRSLIYARMPVDSPEVAATVSWLGQNFDVKKNPGFRDDDPIPNQYGIYFYYLNSLTDALSAANATDMRARDGLAIDWRKEVASELIYRQHADGSWANRVNVMSEDDPVLATSFALLSVSRCLEK